MSWIDFVLSGLLLTASSLAVASHRRYLKLQRKHHLVQQRCTHAEQRLNTLWTPTKS